MMPQMNYMEVPSVALIAIPPNKVTVRALATILDISVLYLYSTIYIRLIQMLLLTSSRKLRWNLYYL